MKKLVKWIFFRHTELSPEEQSFTKDWLIRDQTLYIIGVAKFCRWTIPIFILIMMLNGNASKYWIITATLLVLSVISWLITVLRHLQMHYVRLLVTVASLTIFMGSTSIIIQTFRRPFDLEASILVTQIYIAALIFNIRIFPYRSAWIIPWTAFQTTAAALAFSTNPDLKVPDLIAELILVSGISVGLYYAWMHRLHSEAVLEFKARMILLEDEHARQKSLQKDLENAEATTRGDVVNSSQVLSRDLAISLFERRFSALGGDWGAHRTFPDGKLVIVVADATGKGIQAALVIQALKTMWAMIDDQHSFDPMSWLAMANKVFYQLGHRRDHTLTLGLLVIDESSLTYFAAGHVPVFAIVKNENGDDVVETIVGQGIPLGLEEELSLEPTKIQLNLAKLKGLMLGTDGIFDRGVRTRKRDIIKLQQVFTANGAAALDTLPRHDDQLVVWLHAAA
ncbi:MAG: hypothetical protein FJ146_13120 [Deltaproteobacteria bacterium]|nr:hypothetical protein [Deltaproteobacteria bacterium]